MCCCLLSCFTVLTQVLLTAWLRALVEGSRAVGGCAAAVAAEEGVTYADLHSSWGNRRTCVRRCFCVRLQAAFAAMHTSVQGRPSSHIRQHISILSDHPCAYLLQQLLLAPGDGAAEAEVRLSSASAAGTPLRPGAPTFCGTAAATVNAISHQEAAPPFSASVPLHAQVRRHSACLQAAVCPVPRRPQRTPALNVPRRGRHRRLRKDCWPP